MSIWVWDALAVAGTALTLRNGSTIALDRMLALGSPTVARASSARTASDWGLATKSWHDWHGCNLNTLDTRLIVPARPS